VTEQGGTPVVQDFDDPGPAEGAVLIDVTTAGLGGWDVMGAYRTAISFPCVVRGEGVGRAEDGRRVYFGERALRPFGACGQRTIVPSEEVWDVPDDVDDRLAITMGIAGTGALVPLEQAQIQPGESVLVVGATGGLGQIALQLARHLGAGRVVGAARGEKALARVLERGIADAVVQLGTADDAAALKAEAGEGFDVVLDIVYGPPFLAALKATRFGARIMSIGAQAGRTAEVPLGDLLYRTHTCVGTGQRAPQDRESIWRRLLDIAKADGISVDYVDYPLADAAQAWQAQVASPHAKVFLDVAR
jgi:NADPH:quinone reductase-like Zn-dependent oxidoreductase